MFESFRYSLSCIILLSSSIYNSLVTIYPAIPDVKWYPYENIFHVSTITVRRAIRCAELFMYIYKA